MRVRMYKPNFCAECGERVARERWRVWTSRRFCQLCDVRFRRGRFAAPLFACAALVAAGFAAGRLARPAAPPPPLVIERGGAALVPLPADNATRRLDGQPRQPRPADEPRHGPDGTQGERPTEPDEVVSICGARTQKGTPCQRRVRGTGRCWQHRGKPAMLPPSKLLLTEGR